MQFFVKFTEEEWMYLALWNQSFVYDKLVICKKTFEKTNKFVPYNFGVGYTLHKNWINIFMDCTNWDKIKIEEKDIFTHSSTYLFIEKMA